jgi:hypothetical protein
MIPPMPRWVFSSCCSDTQHCTNSKTESFEMRLLTDFLHRLGTLIQHLVRLGVKNSKVMDTWCTTSCTATSNAASSLEELKKVIAKDGIHFTQAGYKNLADRCTACVHTLCNAPAIIEKHGTFFWRGYRSTRGSARTPPLRAHTQHSRGAPNGAHTVCQGVPSM